MNVSWKFLILSTFFCLLVFFGPLDVKVVKVGSLITLSYPSLDHRIDYVMTNDISNAVAGRKRFKKEKSLGGQNNRTLRINQLVQTVCLVIVDVSQKNKTKDCLLIVFIQLLKWPIFYMK